MKRAILIMAAALLVLAGYSTHSLAGTSRQLDRHGSGAATVLPPPPPAPGAGDGDGSGCEGDADGLAGLRGGERPGFGASSRERAPKRFTIPWRMWWNAWIRLRIG